MDFKGYSKLSEVVFLYNIVTVKTEDVVGSWRVKFWVQGFLGVLLQALGISLSLNFCRHSIIAVTWKCNFLEGLLRTKLAFPRYILILLFMRWEYNQKVQSYNTNRVKYEKPGEYLNCKLKLFYIQSQAPSRKTSNFPATETVRNVDYRSSSI